MDLSAFYNQFRDEAGENIRALTSGLLALESTDPAGPGWREQIDGVFRAVHTIKGSARLLGFEQVGRLAHTCEHMLAAVREGRRPLDRALADDLLRASDALLELINAAVDGRPTAVDVEALAQTLGRGRAGSGDTPEPPAEAHSPAQLGGSSQSTPTEPPAPAAPKAARATRQSVRVRVDRLDRLLNLAGELAVGQQTQLAHGQVLDEIFALVAQQERALLALDRQLKQLRFSPFQREALEQHINGALNAGDHAGKLIRSHVERFGQHTSQTGQLIEDLEQEVMAARLLPISTVFANLPRAVRELARETGKQIELVLSGETTELDRKVIEALGDPLLHLIRNAVDHGVEPPSEREALGKPRQGTIDLGAQAFGSYVHVTLHDDGRGIEAAKLREAAVRKNILTAEAAALLTDQEAIELVFLPGFSTARLITDISGRGVGMDVVRTNVVELGGQVQIESHAGAGTTITLVLPLTLVTTRVLLVEAAGQVFAFPASGCRGSAWVYADRLKTIEGRAMLPYDGRLATLLRLADVLGIAAQAPLSRARMPAVIIGNAQRPLALLVDRLIDEREAVVKPLGPLMEKQRQFGGAIQLGDGRLILLLHPPALAHASRGMALPPTAERNATRRAARLLVADDSFTTRELIRTILQSAGYHVATAVDGLDALDKLRGDTFDLVVSDVEMPRVDGFQLTARIRRELGLSDLPVVIVTSLASEEHKRRGLEAGAQAYIVKSQFDQHGLLETIQQLLA